MNLISKETQISKGKVYYLIKNWKERLEGSDIDKIREFSNLVKSSKVSIEQCAQGFRIINILKSFGIENLDISDKMMVMVMMSIRILITIPMIIIMSSSHL